MTNSRRCAHCDLPLSRLRPQAIYCSRNCKSNARYKRLFADTGVSRQLPAECDLTAAEIDAKLVALDDARRAQRKRFVV